MPRFRDNPAFPADPAEVSADWERMRADPKPLSRPVIVLAGWRAPRLRGRGVATLLRSVTSQRESDFLTVCYPLSGNLSDATRVAMTKVTQRWPNGPPEADAVGISMGGLVARLAAARPDNGFPPLRISRLFTLATPHQGAKLARHVALDRSARDMRPGSPFLEDLERACAPAQYELFCYAQLRDWWVGAGRAAPPGRFAFWTDTRGVVPYLLSHFMINSNRAVLRDIARRLRGEEPVAKSTCRPPCD